MRIGALDFGGTAIKYGVWEAGQLTGLSERPSPTTCSKDVVEALTDIIGSLGKLDAVGISTRGQVDEHGAILYDNGPVEDYTGTPLNALLEARFGIPVWVENDVNAAATGEAVCGAGREYGDFLCLTYGTGVGGAIIRDGCVYHGSSFSAAEFGAIVTHAEARIDGRDFFDGCYERYASTTALVKMAMAYKPELDNGRKIFENLDDPNVFEILDRWVDEIMLGLSTLTHIFNPTCIVLGGGIMVQPLIMEKIRSKVAKYIMPSFAHVAIKPAELGNTAGLLGANYLAVRHYQSANR